jgi:hypothetical protein
MRPQWRSATRMADPLSRMEIFKLAMASGQLGAALNALKELGILFGKRIERAERGPPGEFDRMSDEEYGKPLPIAPSDWAWFQRKKRSIECPIFPLSSDKVS